MPAPFAGQRLIIKSWILLRWKNLPPNIITRVGPVRPVTHVHEPSSFARMLVKYLYDFSLREPEERYV